MFSSDFCADPGDAINQLDSIDSCIDLNEENIIGDNFSQGCDPCVDLQFSSINDFNSTSDCGSIEEHHLDYFSEPDLCCFNPTEMGFGSYSSHDIHVNVEIECSHRPCWLCHGTGEIWIGSENHPCTGCGGSGMQVTH